MCYPSFQARSEGNTSIFSLAKNCPLYSSVTGVVYVLGSWANSPDVTDTVKCCSLIQDILILIFTWARIILPVFFNQVQHHTCQKEAQRMSQWGPCHSTQTQPPAAVRGARVPWKWLVNQLTMACTAASHVYLANRIRQLSRWVFFPTPCDQALGWSELPRKSFL